jgi:flagellar hook-basal body complex protein FliE
MAITALTTATLALTAGGQAAPLATSEAASASKGAGFGSSLTDLISSVDASATDANDAVGKMLDGTGDVHEAMIALQRSDLMLQLTVQVRNKLVQAYQDVMRMPI